VPNLIPRSAETWAKASSELLHAAYAASHFSPCPRLDLDVSGGEAHTRVIVLLVCGERRGP